MSVTRFAAINTKVRALEGHLLQDEDYEHLMEMLHLEEMVTYLQKQTSYSEALSEIEPAKVSIDELEVLFKRELFKKIQGFVHYFTDAYKKLFRILFMRYEVEDLKLFIRALERNEDLEGMLSHMVIMGVSNTFDYKKLSQSRNLEEIVEALAGTQYQELVRYYMNEEPRRRIFYMEMNLDRDYFKKLNAQVDKLDKSDQKPLREILGKNTDILNLQWIYRGRKFYGLGPEELLNYTLLGGHALRYRDLKALCYTKSVEDAVQFIREGPYGFLVEQPDYEIFMELNMERYIYDEFQRLKRSSRLSIIESLVYMHQLEFEVRDLFTIFEAKRYGFGKPETLKYLVHVR